MVEQDDYVQEKKLLHLKMLTLNNDLNSVIVLNDYKFVYIQAGNGIGEIACKKNILYKNIKNISYVRINLNSNVQNVLKIAIH